MTWVVLSPILRAAIADPMSTEINRITRPAQFTRTEIRELYEYGIDTIDEHVEELRDMGYSDDKIEKLTLLMQRMVWRDEIRRWITDMANAYAKGYITDDELMKAIEMGYYTEMERQFRFWEERVRRETEIMDLRVKEIERAFKEGRIDENEARARLSEFIVEPRMVEAYIALWKQYRRPKEVVDPLEELEYRLRRIELRIQGLQKQIEYLQRVMKEQIDVYDAQIEELRTRLEVRIAAAKETFQAWGMRHIAEIEERIAYYQKLLEQATGLTALRYQAAIEMLQAIAQVRVEERAAKLQALIGRWTKETEARIKVIQEKKEKYIAEMERRVDTLKSKLEEYELERDAILRVIEKYKSQGGGA
jgi:ElaB/YqjD/DUF883 family membrane-anchored ribosome-binding protein